MKQVVAALAVSSLLGFSAPTVVAQVNDSTSLKLTTAPRAVYRNGQRSPTRDRYREIQTALKERSYDPGPIDGRWGSKTSAALKRFERDNNLRADGQLDSLVLIVLGLGPKRLNSVANGSH